MKPAITNGSNHASIHVSSTSTNNDILAQRINGKVDVVIVDKKIEHVLEERVSLLEMEMIF